MKEEGNNVDEIREELEGRNGRKKVIKRRQAGRNRLAYEGKKSTERKG